MTPTHEIVVFQQPPRLAECERGIPDVGQQCAGGCGHTFRPEIEQRGQTIARSHMVLDADRRDCHFCSRCCAWCEQQREKSRRELEAYHRQQKVDAENRAARQLTDAIDARESRLRTWAEGVAKPYSAAESFTEFFAELYMCLRSATANLSEISLRNFGNTRPEFMIQVTIDHECSVITLANLPGDTASLHSSRGCIEIACEFQRCGARRFERVFLRSGRPVGCPESEAHPEEFLARRIITGLIGAEA